MLIGEKPGRREAERGIPFIGPAGEYLDIFLNAAAIERDSLYITNLVKEFTEYTKPTKFEIDRDHEELMSEILACDPDIIGLVGAWASEHVLYQWAEMDKIHGVPIHVPHIFGGELTRDRGYTVITLTHPATCTHAPDAMPSVLDDYLTLGKLLDGEITVQEDDPYRGREDYRTLRGDEVWDILRNL